MAGLIVVVGVLVVRNAAGETVLTSSWYVPVNLAVGVVLVGVAVASRLSAAELGLSWSALPRGLRLGGVVAAIVIAAIALVAVVPWTRPMLADERAATIDTGSELAYRALIRIPVGTAVFEEFAFRGVLLALFARLVSMPVAVAASSLLFGLWHIRPTLGALAANELAPDPVTAALLVTLAVMVTTAAGLIFCRLRIVTGSLAAPVLVHAAINSAALVAAYAVLHEA